MHSWTKCQSEHHFGTTGMKTTSICLQLPDFHASVKNLMLILFVNSLFLYCRAKKSEPTQQPSSKKEASPAPAAKSKDSQPETSKQVWAVPVYKSGGREG